MNKPVLGLFVCLFLFQTASFAQMSKVSTDADAKSNLPLSISFQPLYLMNNTIRFDVEMQQKEKASAFIGALEIINGNTQLLYNGGDDNATKDFVSGAGIGLAYKLKLNPSEKLTSFYFSPGVNFRTLKISLKGEDYYAYEEDGIEYYTFGETEKKYPINSAMIFGNLGYHKVWTTTILLDAYLGFGYKLSTSDKLLEANRDYEKPIYGFNYTGFTFQAGIKFGFQIK
ncbi:MAG TPA: hypothetical protein VFM79_11245 [Pelobium sp.]|nr:hypothetical protein [Pelobium sp.]